jgi:hypothetical protein
VEAVVVVKMKIPHTEELQDVVELEVEEEELVQILQVVEQVRLEPLIRAVVVAVVVPAAHILIILGMMEDQA